MTVSHKIQKFEVTSQAATVMPRSRMSKDGKQTDAAERNSYPTKNLQDTNPGRIFFQNRRCFSKIAGNSADTAVNLLRTADLPLW